MTLNEITTIIAEKMGRERDIPFRLMLAERVKAWRSRLIANSLEKNSLQRKFFRQTLYIKMEAKDVLPACAFDGCDKAVTVKQLPELIRHGSTLFDYVGGIDGRSPFREVAVGTSNYLATGRFSDMFPEYEYTNGYIVVPRADLPMIRVDGIFDNPLTVYDYNCESGQDCDGWNKPFPMPGDILQLTLQSVENVDFKSLLNPEPNQDN